MVKQGSKVQPLCLQSPIAMAVPAHLQASGHTFISSKYTILPYTHIFSFSELPENLHSNLTWPKF